MERSARRSQARRESVAVLECRRLELGDAVVVAVRGEIDVSTVSELRAQLMGALLAGTKRMYVDLQDVTFIGSAGIQLLLEMRRFGGDRSASVRLRAPSERVLELLRLSGASRVDIVSSG